MVAIETPPVIPPSFSAISPSQQLTKPRPSSNTTTDPQRLDHFSVVLVTEMMEEAAPFLQWKFGWESVDTHAARGGTSRGSSALEEFKNEPETIQMLHEKHDLVRRVVRYSRRIASLPTLYVTHAQRRG